MPEPFSSIPTSRRRRCPLGRTAAIALRLKQLDQLAVQLRHIAPQRLDLTQMVVAQPAQLRGQAVDLGVLRGEHHFDALSDAVKNAPPLLFETPLKLFVYHSTDVILSARRGEES